MPLRLSVPLPLYPIPKKSIVHAPPLTFAMPTPPVEWPTKATSVVVMFPVPLRLSVPEPLSPITNPSLFHIPADTLAVPIPDDPKFEDPT